MFMLIVIMVIVLNLWWWRWMDRRLRTCQSHVMWRSLLAVWVVASIANFPSSPVVGRICSPMVLPATGLVVGNPCSAVDVYVGADVPDRIVDWQIVDEEIPGSGDRDPRQSGTRHPMSVACRAS